MVDASIINICPFFESERQANLLRVPEENARQIGLTGRLMSEETLTSQTGDNKIRCVRMGMARRSYPDPGYEQVHSPAGAPIHFYGRRKVSLFLFF